ncbi:MAG TPA: hypothetical protein VIG64_14455 [Actinomycetota bacterium]|jgi:uncharacterized membrane protein YgcG
MGIRQAWSDIRELRRELHELTKPSSEEEEATYKIAVSARRFSRRSKHVVDDKLNFSATLMRAGEVDAANRLLEEFERDIRTEEAALIECVNEVKVARSLKRDRVSRLRLVRLMAVALLGACVMSFSALGIAVAGMFQDRANKDAVAASASRHGTRAAVARNRPAKAAHERSRRTMRALQVAGARESLTQQQLDTVRELAISGDDAELTDFLLSVLPATVAEKVSHVLGVVEPPVEAVASAAPEVAVDVADKPTRKAAKKRAEAAAKADAEEEAAKESHETEQSAEGDDTGWGDDSGSSDGSGSGGGKGGGGDKGDGGGEDQGPIPDPEDLQ